MQKKNNLVCKLISALTKCAELRAQKPAITAEEGFVQLFLLSPWAWNTDFAGRLIQLWDMVSCYWDLPLETTDD